MPKQNAEKVLQAASAVLLDARAVRRFGMERPLRLVVGCSGGEDSVVLVHALYVLSKNQPLEVTVCHLNHGLRTESAEEEVFVSQFVGSLGLPFKLFRAPVAPARENLEAWGRARRYEFFRAVREEIGADFIATAHHANDLSETLLSRLFSARLATDAYTLVEVDSDRGVLRPLLSVSKQAVNDYARFNELQFVVDSSNFDISRTRNRIRHELLPVLERDFNPKIHASLSMFAERLSNDERELWGQAKKIFETASGLFAPADLGALPKSFQWRVLALLAENHLGVEARKMGFRALSEAAELACASASSGSNEVKQLDMGFGIVFVLCPPNRVGFELSQRRCSNSG